MALHGLTDMKRTKKDRKNNTDHAVSESPFPFGLSISLDDEALKKLGMKTLPSVGTEMIVAGIGKVESVSERSTSHRPDSRNVTIQLEKLDVGPLKTNEIKTAEDAITKAIKDV